MKLNYLLGAILGVSCAITTPAEATMKNTNPNTTCSYLQEIGLSTRGWKHDYDAEYGCSSSYKEFGSGSPLRNNLAYYVEGKAKKSEILKVGQIQFASAPPRASRMTS